MATEFTPVSALAGGILIGASSAGFYLLNGRIAGISGLLRNVLRFRGGVRAFESAVFLAGLIIAPLTWAFMHKAPLVLTQQASELACP